MNIKEALSVLFTSGRESIDELDLEIRDKEADLTKVVAERQSHIDALKQAREVINIRLNGKPQRGRRKQEKQAETPPSVDAADEAGRNGSMMSDRRKAIAKYLDRYGPTRPNALAENCGIPSGSITAVLHSPCFNKTEAGVRLTEQGRKDLLA